MRIVVVLYLFCALLLFDHGINLADDSLGSDTQHSDPVSYRDEVRPILADTCLRCHGPDEESREADLRLDVEDDVANVINQDDLADSELLARIVSIDPNTVMPPPDSGRRLTEKQISILKRWVFQGAQIDQHWAFQPPRRPDVPELSQLSDWGRNPIDSFVGRRLESTSLRPSKAASPQSLIRRLYLDLVGLPPDPASLRAWVSKLSDTPEGYDQLVTFLLDSPHHGERWARLWLDAARYADSDGYEKDKPREAWFYRDWVIDSFNRDRPYDDFIIRQIAGDLLPGSRQSDRVATGFLRNSMVNEEGGADPEQFRMEGMFDRMDAIGKAVLGVTIQCAQCHSHKYDPLQHEEYYGIFAFLNNTDDAIISVYTAEQEQKRRDVIRRVGEIENEIKTRFPDYRDRMAAWEQAIVERETPDWQTPELFFLDSTLGGQKFLPQSDGSYLCQGYAPTNFKPKMTAKVTGSQITGIRLQMLTDTNLPRSGPGRSVDGTWALSEITAEYALSSNPDEFQKITIARASSDLPSRTRELRPRYDNKKKVRRTLGPVDFAVDGDEKTAWSNDVAHPHRNRSHTGLFEFETPVEIPKGQHAIVHVYLAQRHGGWNSDDNQTINIGRFKLSFTGDEFPTDDPMPIDALGVLKKTERFADDWDVLFSHWRTTVPELTEWNEEIDRVWSEHPDGTTQLTLARRSEPRTTSLLTRGDFLSPEHAVQPHVPEFLHPLPESREPDRLRFARWLVSRQSPTTARSIVNRIWQAYFGLGLVETSDDLGTQSAPPSHPDLLDFLSVELMENGWSLKHIHRLIVTSATYRQSSKVSAELLERDPNNRLLARSPRLRVPAESVRDITLAASGLLNDTVGGPSVYPPAPSFLFQPPVSYGPKVWNVAEDENRYRRALYTFRFRSVPYPMLENFDAVPGNVSCVRRSRSNTPMQALTSLNEPMFMECSIALAKKVMSEAKNDSKRIEQAFLRCVSRSPTRRESEVLMTFLEKQRSRISKSELSAGEILDSVAKTVDVSGEDPNELATWTLLCRVILNLDETITKQ